MTQPRQHLHTTTEAIWRPEAVRLPCTEFSETYTPEKASYHHSLSLVSTLAVGIVGGWAVTHAMPTITAADFIGTDTRAHSTATAGESLGDFVPNRADLKYRIRTSLKRFRNFPEAWDGHDGRPASSQAVSDALQFLELLSPGSPLPRPGLSGDGEIGFFWDYGDSFIDVGFTGDGTYSFYAREQRGRELFGDSMPLLSSPDEELLRVIREYA
mgnify:CR=1 FL=1